MHTQTLASAIDRVADHVRLTNGMPNIDNETAMDMARRALVPDEADAASAGDASLADAYEQVLSASSADMDQALRD